jgi:mannose-6-phosphate isomerase-like protein (cupin superfamily)
MDVNMSDEEATGLLRHALPDYRWDGVDLLAYKDEGAAPFRAITRQVLFHRADLGCEFRYFEVQPGGYSTLERHEHVHAVMVARGRGHCLLGDEVHAISERDLVTIPPMTWHQFRATMLEPLGFLCMVNVERDRPQLPTPDDLAKLRSTPHIAAFLDGRLAAEHTAIA